MESNFIDWHPADIIAGLRKKGTSMAAESRRNGLSSSTLANALSRPWPKGEMIIAKATGTDPRVIWPSRYHDPQTHEFIDRTQLMRSYTKPKNEWLGGSPANGAASSQTITRLSHAQYLHLKRVVCLQCVRSHDRCDKYDQPPSSLPQYSQPAPGLLMHADRLP